MDDRTISIRQGDLYEIDGVQYRLFFVSTELIGAISMTTVHCENFATPLFVEAVKAGEYRFISQNMPAMSISLTSEEQAELRKRAALMDMVLKEQYPAWPRFGKPKVIIPVMDEAARELGLTPKHFKQVFYHYLRSGRDENSLIDGRKTKLARKEIAALSPDLSQEPKVEVLTKKDEALAFGLSVFKDRLNVQAAYEYMQLQFYSTTRLEMVNGTLQEVVIPDSSAPSYCTLHRYISRNLGGLTVGQYIRGEKEVRNNERYLTGNQRSGLISIGQLVQVDECEVAVSLVDANGTVIGKPVLYCAFDPEAQIIIGAYIGLINNSMGGFVNLFLSMLEPHENQTAPYGVHCDEYSFPSMVIPRAIYSDQGAEYRSKHMEAAMQELGVVDALVPVAAGSYKGGVENVFHRLQSRLKKQLANDGYIVQSHEGANAAREAAVLSMDGFKAICYRLIIEINTSSLGKQFSPDMDLIENKIPPVPAAIWKHKMKTCFDPVVVTDQNRMQIMFALLWRDKKFVRGRDGLTYKSHNLRYFLNEDWFKELLKAPDPVFEVRYNDTDIERIFVRYKDIIRVVPLANARDELRSFLGMSWTAYDEAYKQYKQLRKEQLQLDRQTRLTTIYKNDQVLNAEKAAHGDLINNTSDRKEARAVERARIETSHEETRRRLLVGHEADSIPVQEEVPVKEEGSSLLHRSNDDLLAMLGDDEYE